MVLVNKIVARPIVNINTKPEPTAKVETTQPKKRTQKPKNDEE